MRTNRRTSGVSDQNGARRAGHAGALLAPCLRTVTQVISPLDSSPLAEVPLFSSYRLNGSYDERFARAGRARVPYASLVDELRTLQRDELSARQTDADKAFLTQGITFTVYGDDEG